MVEMQCDVFVLNVELQNFVLYQKLKCKEVVLMNLLSKGWLLVQKDY